MFTFLLVSYGFPFFPFFHVFFPSKRPPVCKRPPVDPSAAGGGPDAAVDHGHKVPTSTSAEAGDGVGLGVAYVFFETYLEPYYVTFWHVFF